MAARAWSQIHHAWIGHPGAGDGSNVHSCPFMMPRGVIAKTSEFRLPVPTYMPMEMRGAKSFLRPPLFARGLYKLLSPNLTKSIRHLRPYVLPNAVLPSVPTLYLVSKNAAWHGSHTSKGWLAATSMPSLFCRWVRSALHCLLISRTPTSINPFPKSRKLVILLALIFS